LLRSAFQEKRKGGGEPLQISIGGENRGGGKSDCLAAAKGRGKFVFTSSIKRIPLNVFLKKKGRKDVFLKRKEKRGGSTSGKAKAKRKKREKNTAKYLQKGGRGKVLSLKALSKKTSEKKDVRRGPNPLVQKKGGDL